MFVFIHSLSSITFTTNCEKLEYIEGISNVYGAVVIVSTYIHVVNPVLHTQTSKGDEPARFVIVTVVGIIFCLK